MGTPLAWIKRVPNGTRSWSKGLRRLLVAAVLAASGCYASTPIKPSELARLDGYENGAPRGGRISVLSPTNQPVEIAGGSLIILDLPQGTRGGQFRSIQVRDGIFYGETMHGQSIQAPLASVSAARVKGPDPGGSQVGWALLAVGIMLGAVVGYIAYGVSQTRAD
jgi:hypothetical protein